MQHSSQIPKSALCVKPLLCICTYLPHYKRLRAVKCTLAFPALIPVLFIYLEKMIMTEYVICWMCWIYAVYQLLILEQFVVWGPWFVWYDLKFKVPRIYGNLVRVQYKINEEKGNKYRWINSVYLNEPAICEITEKEYSFIQLIHYSLSLMFVEFCIQLEFFV